MLGIEREITDVAILEAVDPEMVQADRHLCHDIKPGPKPQLRALSCGRATATVEDGTMRIGRLLCDEGHVKSFAPAELNLETMPNVLIRMVGRDSNRGVDEMYFFWGDQVVFESQRGDDAAPCHDIGARNEATKKPCVEVSGSILRIFAEIDLHPIGSASDTTHFKGTISQFHHQAHGFTPTQHSDERPDERAIQAWVEFPNRCEDELSRETSPRRCYRQQVGGKPAVLRM